MHCMGSSSDEQGSYRVICRNLPCESSVSMGSTALMRDLALELR